MKTYLISSDESEKSKLYIEINDTFNKLIEKNPTNLTLDDMIEKVVKGGRSRARKKMQK